ncbi:MAG: response regulator [Thermodesulfovibrionales bacterium]|nr:response regulator [Thermodesulfovibrionales bacterium]
MPERILIIDDEPDMLVLLSMIIKGKTTYEVVSTSNPYEALEWIKKDGFDLVITDLKMPGLDGMEILKTIRERDEDVPVIIITAYGTVESAIEAMSMDAFDFITKPFRKEQILFTIDKAIKWLKTIRENKMLKQQLSKDK